MDIVERATEMLRHPENEWAAVEQDASIMRDLALGYVAPLAAIPAVAGLLGTWVVGVPGYKISLIGAIFQALLDYAIDIGAIYALAYLMIRLAPRFGAKPALPTTFQVAVYSFTPVWISGIVGLIPATGLLKLAGYGYAVYLMSMGAERLLSIPQGKSLPYAGMAIGGVFIGLFIIHHLVAAFGGIPRLL